MDPILKAQIDIIQNEILPELASLVKEPARTHVQYLHFWLNSSRVGGFGEGSHLQKWLLKKYKAEKEQVEIEEGGKIPEYNDPGLPFVQSKPIDQIEPTIPPVVFQLDDGEVAQLCECLSKFFPPDQHSTLEQLFKGLVVNNPLHFKGRQNRLSDLFARLEFSRKISGEKTEISNWVSHAFCCLDSSGTLKPVNADSVRQGFTRNHPKKEDRLCVFEWLPPLPHSRNRAK
ncbi:hypothetical protein [Larkinella rosea]|uniref:Uncharacterized protein n=1 Tax=Larkinella rosea TaxID=2025312 RepID=A0A3P1BLZ3_9BACT|nr:hypothetical protein [Larkinella rosea]RRB02061.1 hypothetical protein EHT25_16350 [Larkinella rosea]